MSRKSVVTQPGYQVEEARIVEPGTDGEGISPDVVRKLRPGQGVLVETGITAQVGVVEECWLSAKPLHTTERGNVLLDFRFPRYKANTPGVRVREYENGRAPDVDYEEARINLRRKDWLRVDPILALFNIDPSKLNDLPEDMMVDTIAPLQCPEFWSLVAEFNDVSYREEYLSTVRHSGAAEVLKHLKVIKADDIYAVTKVARANAEKWIAAMKGVK